jgi:hypothetical protein
MQDRYTGDVGDFGKYGLLRVLCSPEIRPQLKLAVVWYLVPSETHNEDGKHINYLRDVTKASARRLRKCDPILYDGLRKLLVNDRNEIVAKCRRVEVIETSDLLPPGTMFYSVPLSYSQQMPTSARLAARRTWMVGALQATASADVVFLDPDNGIECKSVERTALTGPKYVYWDEIESFVDRGQSVVIYHHLNRSCSSTEQVERLKNEFCQRVPENCNISKIIYRRGTRRAYFIVMAARHRAGISDQLSNILTKWENHFVI